MAGDKDNLDDLPSLDAVMQGFSGMSNLDDSKPGKDETDYGFDLDDKPFSRFTDDDGNLENDPKRKQTDASEVVFDVLDEDQNTDLDDEEFRDNRKRPEKKKDNRLQREMRLKTEARDQLGQLATHYDKLAAEVTQAHKNHFTSQRNLAEVVKNQALADLARFDQDITRAQEDGDTAKIRQIAQDQARANDVILKADALIERYAPDKVERYVYQPEAPVHLRDPNKGGTSRGRDWMDANSEWFNNPDKYGAEIAMARAIDQQLAKEGKFKPDTEEYYTELTRQVALKTRGSIDVYTTDGRVARVGGERQRGGGGRVDHTGSSTPSGGNQNRNGSGQGQRETLTAEEQRFMRGFGINVNDKEHRKALSENKMK
jgi:hypothetical protein